MTESSSDIERLRALVGSERDPGGRAFATLAHALLEAGRPNDAHEVVEAGRSTHPDFATGHVVAALVNLALAAREPARAAFRRVLQLDPDNRLALRGLADLSEDDGEPVEALSFLEPLAELEPEDLGLKERILRLEASAAAGAVASELPPPPEADVVPEVAFVGEEPGEEPFEPVDDPLADVSAVVEDEAVLTGKSDPSPEGLHTASVDPLTPAGREVEADDGMAWARERGQEAVPDVGEDEVFTRTMAELLADQGQFAEAVNVYERLLELDPDDAPLRGRLEQLRELAASEEPESVPAPTPPAVLSEPARAEVRDYFEELLAAHGEEPVLGPDLLSAPSEEVEDGSRDAVPVAELAPHPVPVSELAPETMSEPLPTSPGSALSESSGRVPVAGVGPDPTPVGTVGPDPVPVSRLAPDPVPIAELGPDAVPVRDLAPGDPPSAAVDDALVDRPR